MSGGVTRVEVEGLIYMALDELIAELDALIARERQKLVANGADPAALDEIQAFLEADEELTAGESARFEYLWFQVLEQFRSAPPS